MPDFYSEPFLQLAGLTHRSALITWGAFYFKIKDSGATFKLVDDDDLRHIHPPRKDTIGARSAPYGPAAVEVFDKSGKLVTSASTTTTNYCWVTGLDPDTDYTYRVTVKGDVWAKGERREWVASDQQKGLRGMGKQYENRFRTYPDPSSASEALTFAVIGDFGTGIKKKDRPQGKVADALMQAVDKHGVRFILTTGDNIYASRKIFGIPVGGQGDEDDDWYFTFYQPYRYLINRLPVYPSIGNHDADESEDREDRDQVLDNFYIAQRIEGEEAVGRASTDPGLFYRFRYGADIELICIDTSRESMLFGDRLYKHPKHADFLNRALPPAGTSESSSPLWRIPFGHHPPFSAGPRHRNTSDMEQLVGKFHQTGVRVVFSGHEHNFQHSQFQGVNYFVTGAAGKLREDPPDGFSAAHTVSWAAALHFLLVTIDGKRMTVRAIGTDAERVKDIVRNPVAGDQVATAMIITLD